jgi:hypothetical protein
LIQASILTQKQLESLTEADDGRRLTDKDGLYGNVRTGKRGVSVLFRWRFRHDGKFQDFNCGTWPRDKLSAIRDKRREAEAVLKTGANPSKQKKLSKLQAIQAEKVELAQLAADAAALRTLESALDDWFASKEITDRKDKGGYLKRAFKKDILPKLGGVAISDLKKGMVMDILLDVAKRAPVMGNRIRQESQAIPHQNDRLRWDQINIKHLVAVGTKDRQIPHVIVFPVAVEVGNFQNLLDAKSTIYADRMIGSSCNFDVIDYLIQFQRFELSLDCNFSD